MSATTSPRATIFPKFRSRPGRRPSDPDLAEGSYLLFGVAGLPQGHDDVALEVGYVAGYEARLTLGDHPHLAYGSGQDARLGAPELLGPSVVLDPHRVAHAGEREAALRVRRLRIGLAQRPALEGEVRTRAAEDAAYFAFLEDEARVRTRQVVHLQLVEGGFYVRVPGLLAEGLAIEVCRRDELAQVRGLLDLKDQGVRPEGVDDPARDVHRVPRSYLVAGHHGVVLFSLERLEELLAPRAFSYAGQDG